MKIRTLTGAAGAMAIALLVSTAMLSATTVTNGGITLEYPTFPINGTGLLHCEPWNDPAADDITFTGVPTNVTSITLQFSFSSGVLGAPLTFPAPITLTNFGDGSFSVTIPYPQDHSTWPGQSNGTSTIVLGVGVIVTRADGTKVKFSSGQWKVRCIPDEPDEPGPFEGCTLGYWKQDQHFDSWVDYVPGDYYESVFGRESNLDPPGPGGAFANPTLLDALEIGGGDGADGQNGMARQAVAALLNASSPDVDFPMTVTEVIQKVQDAYDGVTTFAAAHALFEGYNTLITTLSDGTRYHCGLN